MFRSSDQNNKPMGSVGLSFFGTWKVGQIISLVSLLCLATVAKPREEKKQESSVISFSITYSLDSLRGFHVVGTVGTLHFCLNSTTNQYLSDASNPTTSQATHTALSNYPYPSRLLAHEPKQSSIIPHAKVKGYHLWEETCPYLLASQVSRLRALCSKTQRERDLCDQFLHNKVFGLLSLISSTKVFMQSSFQSQLHQQAINSIQVTQATSMALPNCLNHPRL